MSVVKHSPPLGGLTTIAAGRAPRGFNPATHTGPPPQGRPFVPMVRNQPVRAGLGAKRGRIMPEETFPRTSAYWFAKAEEARTIAEGMRNPVAAATMVQIAES